MMKSKLLSLLGYGAGVALLVHKSRPTVISTTDKMVTPGGQRRPALQEAPARKPESAGEPVETSHRPPKPAPKGALGYIKATFSAFMDDDCMTSGASVAYYTAFSLPPLLLLIISVAGFVFGRAAVQGEIQKQMGALVGGGTRPRSYARAGSCTGGNRRAAHTIAGVCG